MGITGAADANDEAVAGMHRKLNNGYGTVGYSGLRISNDVIQRLHFRRRFKIYMRFDALRAHRFQSIFTICGNRPDPLAQKWAYQREI
jgi:hypothetical protein